MKVASFVLIILMGALFSRFGNVGRGSESFISRVVFRFTLPAAIINAFGSADFQIELLLLVALGFVCTAVPFLVALGLFRGESAENRAFYLLNVGGMNIGCFALPFIQAMFPPAAVVAACMFDAGNSIMATGGSFALTKVLLGQDGDGRPVPSFLRRLFSSTPFDCYVVLIALGLAGVRLPRAVIDLTAPVSSANAFLSLFMLGLMVSARLDGNKLGKLGRLLGLRVLLCAVMSGAVMLVLPLDVSTARVIALVLWAPIPSMSPVFTGGCGGDYGLSGLAGAISIVLGIVVMMAMLPVFGAM